MIYPILLCLSIASGCIASLYFEACLLVALLWSLVLPVLAMGFAVLFLEKPPWLIRGTNGALNMQIVGFAAKMYNGKITDPLHDYGLNFR